MVRVDLKKTNTVATYPHHLVIIIPESLQANANALAAQLDPQGGGGNTFGACKLSRTQGGTVTHYACDSLFEESKFDALPAYSGILGADGLAADLVTGQQLLPGASAWIAGPYAGKQAEDVFTSGGWYVLRANV